SLLPPPPLLAHFPYTTLFRSLRGGLDPNELGFDDSPASGVRLPLELEHGGAARADQPDLDEPVAADLGLGHDLARANGRQVQDRDRKSTRLNSSHVANSYAVL